MELDNNIPPMIRRYESKPIHKDDLKKELHPQRCEECPLCREVMKDEFKELFDKEIHIRIKNPFYKEYVSDGKCDYGRSFHHIHNPQYIHILDPKYYSIKQKQQEIINKYGENHLYHLVCKKSGEVIHNEYASRNCVVISDGVFPMRRPQGSVFYVDFKFDGAVEPNKKDTIEKSHAHNINLIHDETDLPLKICKKIYDMFQGNRNEIDKYIDKLIKGDN